MRAFAVEKLLPIPDAIPLQTEKRTDRIPKADKAKIFTLTARNLPGECPPQIPYKQSEYQNRQNNRNNRNAECLKQKFQNNENKQRHRRKAVQLIGSVSSGHKPRKAGFQFYEKIQEIPSLFQSLSSICKANSDSKDRGRCADRMPCRD